MQAARTTAPPPTVARCLDNEKTIHLLIYRCYYCPPAMLLGSIFRRLLPCAHACMHVCMHARRQPRVRHSSVRASIYAHSQCSQLARLVITRIRMHSAQRSAGSENGSIASTFQLAPFPYLCKFVRAWVLSTCNLQFYIEDVVQCIRLAR